MQAKIVTVLSHAAEIGLFFVAAAAIVIGVLAIK